MRSACDSGTDQTLETKQASHFAPRKTGKAKNHTTQTVHGKLTPRDLLWNEERVNAFSK